MSEWRQNELHIYGTTSYLNIDTLERLYAQVSHFIHKMNNWAPW